MILHRGLGATTVIAALTLLDRSCLGDSPAMPTTLRCEFASQVSTVSKSATVFSTRTMNSSAGLEALTFTEIDPVAQTARVAGDAGPSTARLMATSAALIFLELTESDNVDVTHVFRGDESRDGVYRAVHARQSIERGAIGTSLHYGECRPLN